MASSYSPKLRFELIAPGEQAGLWGDTTNNNIGALIEQAIAGVANIDLSSRSGDVVLEAKDGTEDQARSAVLSCFGTSAGDVNLVIPASTKLYVVRNSSSHDVYVKTASQTLGTKIGAGEANLVYCDGANAQAGIVIAGASVTPVSAGGTGVGSPGFTAGYLKSPGGTTQFGTVASIPATDISGQVQIAQGGTGVNTAPSAGSLLIGTSTGGYAVGSITGSGGITVTPSSGGINISQSSSSGVSSFNGRVGAVTPVSTDYSSYYYSTSNPSGFITSSGVAFLSNTGTQTFNGTINGQAFIAQGAGSIGDQKITVSYSGVNSGMSPQGMQMGRGGSGAIYDTATRVLGFINNTSSLSITPPDAVGFAANSVYTSGVDAFKGGTSTAWIVTSDARIKKNVTPYTKGLAELNQIQIKNYEFNGLAGTEDGAKGLGVIADEIEKVLPNTVGTSKVKLNPDDAEPVDLKHFDSTELVYLLVNAVKELKAEVDALKAAK